MNNVNDQTNNSKVCVGIAAIIGGVSLGVVAIIAIFLPQQLPVAAWVVVPLCFMGVALGLLSTHSISR